MINSSFYSYCDEREAVRTYRVDRIKKQPEILKEKAVKKPKGYNVSKYTTEVFRMFSTDEAIDVTLLCDNCIMKSVVDKFGMKIKTQSVGEEKFRIKVKVCVSPTFYRWVFGATGKSFLSAIFTASEKNFRACAQQFAFITFT